MARVTYRIGGLSMAKAIVGRRYRRRVLVNRIMLVLTVLATLISLVPLVLIILYVAKQGISSLTTPMAGRTMMYTAGWL